MKNLLVIMTGTFPDDLSSGGKQAVYNSVDFLRSHFHVTVLYKASLPKSKETLKKLKQQWDNVDFCSYTRDWSSNSLWLYVVEKVLLRLVFRSKQSAFIHELKHKMVYTDKLVNTIHDIIKERNIDLVMTEFYPSTELGYCLPDNVKKVFVQHEIRFVRNAQVLCKSGMSSPVVDFYYNKCKAEEIAAMNSYDAVLTLTDEDKEKLLKNGVCVPVYSSPACISTSVSSQPFRPAKTVVSYLGGAGHGPNADGVKWFVDNIWPFILKSNPDAQFQVIGNWPEDQRRMYRNVPNMVFKGIVENLEGVLPQSILVIPLLIGSGMRMKALEGIANKCCIVSTRVGIEGLPFRNGVDCYMEDAPEEFARRVVELLDNPVKQELLWKGAYEWYNQMFSKEALMGRRGEILDEILEK